MTNMRRHARLLSAPPLPVSMSKAERRLIAQARLEAVEADLASAERRRFAQQDAAFFEAMRRGRECDERCLEAVERCGKVLDTFPAMPFGPALSSLRDGAVPSPPSGFPSLSQGDHA